MRVLVFVALAALASSAWATSSYVSLDGREIGLSFNDGSGLSAFTVMRLGADNKSLEITLKNTSTALPAYADPADYSSQILTSFYFDLGPSGLNSGDPKIVGGSAAVAAGSSGIGVNLSGGSDISSNWGYGNFKYEGDQFFLPPNFVTALQSHSTAFAKGKLNGPDFGAASMANLANVYDSGFKAISDTVVLQVRLSHQLNDLHSVLMSSYGPRVEFGSDYLFMGHTPPRPGIDPVPEPLTAVAMTLALGSLGTYLWRRHRKPSLA